MGAVSNAVASIDPTTSSGRMNLISGGIIGGAAGAGEFVDQNLLGGAQADATEDAAREAEELGRLALGDQREATAQTRSDLSTFRGLGETAAPKLEGAIDNPSSRVLNNPFFQAMSADQDERLLASRAARGKVGSGGTEDSLKRNLILFGNDFAQQDITNLQNLTSTGANAAAQTGSFLQQGTAAAGGIMGNIANANAAGTIGAANARAQGVNNVLSIGSAALSDVRLKENVKFSHMQDDIRMYNWDWTEEGKALAGDQITTGPIAQELKINHPELVVMDEEIGFYRVLM